MKSPIEFKDNSIVFDYFIWRNSHFNLTERVGDRPQEVSQGYVLHCNQEDARVILHLHEHSQYPVTRQRDQI